MRDLWTVHLGVVDYREVYDLQARIRAARQEDAIADVLLLLEHTPVYTRGRRTKPGELGMAEDWYRARGIDVVDTDRGGKVTYHGPGQLVGYPIMRIDDVGRYVRTMEGALVAALGDEGLAATGRTDDGADFTGVWVGERKIASIGVRVRRGVTMHGFAVNVDDDLAPFGWVIPCGLPDVQMTSLALETGRLRALPCFRRRAALRFAQAFGFRQRIVPISRLERELARVAAVV